VTIEELNKAVLNGNIDNLILVSEARQIKALSKIADKISAKGSVKLLLIAGPSSAGKTTTSKRLVTQLAVNGIESISLSTDDYFVGDARNPRDENGEFDYEHIDCVDIPKLVEAATNAQAPVESYTLEDVFAADKAARDFVKNNIG
jgi:uridine kinase